MKSKLENNNLRDWEKSFNKINLKLGNDVWGVAMEGDGIGGRRIRIYVNNETMIDKVLKLTKGKILTYSIVFSIHNQEDYNKFLNEKEKKRKE